MLRTLSTRLFSSGRLPHVNIGTIGHVDHGKTTLTAAITNYLAQVYPDVNKSRSYDQIDKTKEERERGITITAAHVEYSTDKRHYSHIDCPGHQDFIKNMIVGASQMDGGILVVAADSGAQAQTREHILLCREVGVKKLVVYLNKVDMLGGDEDLIEMAEDEVRSMLEFYNFDAECPVIRGSARSALEGDTSEFGAPSIGKLMEAVDEYITIPERDTTGPFAMPIEDVFSISGRGTVVTGKINRGTIKVGDPVEAVGVIPTKKTTATGVEQFHKSLESAVAGENVGVLLRGVDRNDVTRGQMLAVPGSFKPTTQFQGKAYLLKDDEGGRSHAIYSRFQPQFFIRSANVTGTINLPDKADGAPGMMMPGDTGEMDIELMAPLALEEGLKFTIREGKQTVGAGVITKVM